MHFVPRIQYDSATTRSWWLATLFCTLLTLGIYEPLLILFFMVMLPHLLRRKLKPLTDGVGLEHFPFATPLREFPTSYISEKHAALKVSRYMMTKRRSSRLLLNIEDDEKSGKEPSISTPDHDHHAFALVKFEKTATIYGTRFEC